PHGALNIVAEHEGRIVGHYALLPLEMKFGEKAILGAKAEGLLVHKDYRGAAGKHFLEPLRMSVLHGMVTAAFERAEEIGVRLIWGFPNRLALRGQLKSGYRVIAVSGMDLVSP